MEIDHMCANPACQCRVQQAGDYCDDACRRQAERNDPGPCQCAHTDCGTSTPDTPGVPEQGDGTGESAKA